MSRSDAVRKITALLRLAERGGTSEEAASAAAMAQALMDKYEIESAALALDGAPEEPEESPMDSGDTPGGSLEQSGRLERWRVALARALVNVNGCFLYTSRRNGKKTIEIVGRPSQAETVRYLYGWLTKEVERLRESHGKGLGPVWRREFSEGVVDTLRERLKGQRAKTLDEMRAAATTSTALVRINSAVAKVETYGREAMIYARSKHSFRSGGGSYGGQRNDSARGAGRAAGHGVPLGGNARRVGQGQQRQIGGGK